jgi:hypothetical protein
MGSDLDGAELQVDINGNRHVGPVSIKQINNKILEQRTQVRKQTLGQKSLNFADLDPAFDVVGGTVNTANSVGRILVQGYKISQNGTIRKYSTNDVQKQISKTANNGVLKNIDNIGKSFDALQLTLNTLDLVTAKTEEEKTEATKNLVTNGAEIGGEAILTKLGMHQVVFVGYNALKILEQTKDYRKYAWSAAYKQANSKDATETEKQHFYSLDERYHEEVYGKPKSNEKINPVIEPKK